MEKQRAPVRRARRQQRKTRSPKREQRAHDEIMGDFPLRASRSDNAPKTENKPKNKRKTKNRHKTGRNKRHETQGNQRQDRQTEKKPLARGRIRRYLSSWTRAVALRAFAHQRSNPKTTTSRWGVSSHTPHPPWPMAHGTLTPLWDQM